MSRLAGKPPRWRILLKAVLSGNPRELVNGARNSRFKSSLATTFGPHLRLVTGRESPRSVQPIVVPQLRTTSNSFEVSARASLRAAKRASPHLHLRGTPARRTHDFPQPCAGSADIAHPALATFIATAPGGVRGAAEAAGAAPPPRWSKLRGAGRAARRVRAGFTARPNISAKLKAGTGARRARRLRTSAESAEICGSSAGR